MAIGLHEKGPTYRSYVRYIFLTTLEKHSVRAIGKPDPWHAKARYFDTKLLTT
jgi:hypothetical protein